MKAAILETAPPSGGKKGDYAMSVAASSEENALPLSLPLSTSIHLCFDPSFRTPVEEQIRRIAGRLPLAGL